MARAEKILRRWTWYHLQQFRGAMPDLDKSSSIAGVRNGLRQAVDGQMVADVPVGAFLSGGLDSSAIVALARKQNPEILCFTIDALGGQEEGATDICPTRSALRAISAFSWIWCRSMRGGWPTTSSG